MRAFAAVCVVVVVLLGLVFAALPWWLPLVAERAVSGARLENVSWPGWSRWQIGRVLVEQPAFTADLKDVTATYDLWSQHIELIEVREASLRQLSDASTGEGGEVPSLPPLQIHRFDIQLLGLDDMVRGKTVVHQDGTFELIAETAGGSVSAYGTWSADELQAEGGISVSQTLFEALQLTGPVEMLEGEGEYGFVLTNPQTPQLDQFSGSFKGDVRAAVRVADDLIMTGLSQLAVSRQDVWIVWSPSLMLDAASGWAWQTPIQGRLDDEGVFSVDLGRTLSFSGLWHEGDVEGSGELTLGDDVSGLVAHFVPGLDVRGSARVQLEGFEAVKVKSLDELRLKMGDLKVNVAEVSGALEGAEWQVRLVNVSAMPFPPVAIDVKGRLSTPEIATGLVSGSGLTASLSIKAHEQVELDGEYTVAVEQPLLAHWLGWTEAYDLHRGTIAGTFAAAQMPDALRYNVQGRLTNGQAHYDDMVARGVSAVFDMAGNGSEWQVDLKPLTASEVDTGVVLEQFELTGRVTSDRARIGSFSAGVLGGEAALAQPFVYDLNAGNARFDVVLDRLDLAKIVGLEGDDVQATGRVSGNLPVRMRANTPSVDGGTFTALAPGGTVALSPDVSRAMNQPGVDFALRALEDFRFEALDARVDYSESGDLLAAVRLEGANPAIEGGRPIHYNLNISENVPVLLESLRLQDEVTKRVEKKVNDQGGR